MHVMKKKDRIKRLEFELNCLDSSHEDLIIRMIKTDVENEELKSKLDAWRIVAIMFIAFFVTVMTALCTL